MMNVPREKCEDFFDRFGDYYHVNRTPEEEHQKAIMWLLANAAPSEKPKVTDVSGGHDINSSRKE